MVSMRFLVTSLQLSNETNIDVCKRNRVIRLSYTFFFVIILAKYQGV